MALVNKNNVYIVGELVEVKDFREGVYGGDKNYVSATVVVKSIVDGEELLTEARTFISELTNKGTVNKNYSVIKNIESMLDKRVVISGATITGDRFWSERTSQLVNSTRINFNLIRLARASDKEDTVTFEFGGFVTRPISEVLDQDQNLKYYQISLGQANYKEDNMFECNFIVDKDNQKAAQAMMDKYEAGATVEINGICKTIVNHREVETEVAFGDPIKKVYTNVDKKFIIQGGTDVISGEGEYTEEVIQKLIGAYTERGKELQKEANEKAHTNSANTHATNASKPKAKASSLVGLL